MGELSIFNTFELLKVIEEKNGKERAKRGSLVRILTESEIVNLSERIVYMIVYEILFDKIIE